MVSILSVVCLYAIVNLFYLLSKLRTTDERLLPMMVFIATWYVVINEMGSYIVLYYH